MTGAGLIIKAYGNFFINGDEKKKFFNGWFIGLVEFIELRVPQSFHPYYRSADSLIPQFPASPIHRFTHSPLHLILFFYYELASFRVNFPISPLTH